MDHEESQPADPQSLAARARILSIVGLISVFLGPVLYMVLIDQSMLRRTGLIAWVLMADGIVLTVLAYRIDRSMFGRLAMGATVFLTVLFLLGFFVLAKLPESSLDTVASAPDFTLLNQDSEPVSLRAQLASGPAYLVFYRGHW